MRYWMHLHNWRYEARKKVENLQVAIAWMVPRWLVKWAAIRLMCHATQGQYANQIVPELTAMDALKRWYR